jgi:hypothetical protein
LLDGIEVSDSVRFILRGTVPNLFVREWLRDVHAR